MPETEQDIEFIPSDELEEETEVAAEDDAVRPDDREQPQGLLLVEADEFEADELDEDQADELQSQVDENAAEADPDPDEADDEEHEEDLKEVLSRHYGIVEEEPDETPALVDEKPRPLRPNEFVCQSCFLRRHRSQLSDPTHVVCVDCVADVA